MVSACSILKANNNLIDEKISSFLIQNKLVKPDLMLYGNSFINIDPLSNNILGIKTFNYSNLAGIYFTNSSFATQLAVEILSNSVLADSKGLKAENILIVNKFYNTDWGLIYLSNHK